MLSASSRIGIVVCIFAFGFLYIIQTSTVSVSGYDIGSLRKQVNELKYANDSIQVQIANYRSMKSIESRLAGLHFEPVRDVAYVKMDDHAVARR